MTPEQAAEVLRYLNEWRRGAEGEQPDPKTIGIAIDTAIECMSASTPTDYCPCTPDETTGEMSANEGKTWQCNICGKTVNPSDHTRLNTPTDEQIGKLFDQLTDVSVLLNPISPTHAMTRTAAIQFAREVLTLGKSK